MQFKKTTLTNIGKKASVGYKGHGSKTSSLSRVLTEQLLAFPVISVTVTKGAVGFD